MQNEEIFGVTVWDRLLACTLDDGDRYPIAPPSFDEARKALVRMEADRSSATIMRRQDQEPRVREREGSRQIQ